MGDLLGSGDLAADGVDGVEMEQKPQQDTGVGRRRRKRLLCVLIELF